MSAHYGIGWPDSQGLEDDRTVPVDEDAVLEVRLHCPGEDQALDVAAYVVSRPRPDLPGKEHDWPNGGAPADAAYPVLSMKR